MLAAIVGGLIACACVAHAYRRGDLQERTKREK